MPSSTLAASCTHVGERGWGDKVFGFIFGEREKR
jgi:hypothetical protein